MKRNLNGIFLLDKPSGISSNHALQRVKRLFNAAKAGHTGSLDPLATGMLPICFGEATKFSQHLLDANKVYEVTALLGVRTDSGDSEGRIIAEKSVEISQQALLNILPSFTGKLKQVPPMYSALKHKGRPLYEYARKGEMIDRPPREVTIYKLDLIEMRQKHFSLRVGCSKGTYIRSLIDDIGEALGCGAHVTALRRSFVEPFADYPMINFEILEASQTRDDFLLPIDAALSSWPQRIVDNNTGKRLLNGLEIVLDASLNPVSVRFYSEAGSFLGVGVIDQDGRVVDKRLVSLALVGLS